MASFFVWKKRDFIQVLCSEIVNFSSMVSLWIIFLFWVPFNTLLKDTFSKTMQGTRREKAQKYAAGYCSSWGTYSVFYQFFSLFL